MHTQHPTPLAVALVLLAGGAAAPALAQQEGAEQDTTSASRAEMHPMRPMPPGRMQGHPHGHGLWMPGHGMRRGTASGMPRGHGTLGMHAGATAFGPGPMMLLRQQEALELTGEQVTRLEGLRDEMHDRLEARRESLEELHDRLREFTEAEEPDLERYRELLTQLADARVETAMEMARTHQRARAALTEQQRANVEYLRQLMRRGDGPGAMRGPGATGGRRGAPGPGAMRGRPGIHPRGGVMPALAPLRGARPMMGTCPRRPAADDGGRGAGG